MVGSSKRPPPSKSPPGNQGYKTFLFVTDAAAKRLPLATLSRTLILFLQVKLEPTRIEHVTVSHSLVGSPPYPQILDYSAKRRTLQPFLRRRQRRIKTFYNNDTGVDVARTDVGAESVVLQRRVQLPGSHKFISRLSPTRRTTVKSLLV
jgi:hypothetical protein